MNRLGMIIDLSHSSVQTATDTLAVSEAPVIFSHSSAKTLCNSTRNVPNSLLKLLVRFYSYWFVDAWLYVGKIPKYITININPIIFFLNWYHISCALQKSDFSKFSFQKEKKGLVMINFFSYFLTCSNHSTVNDVIGKFNKEKTCCMEGTE